MATLSRTTLQKLATAKADDASILFAHHRYSNSYYLYGYAVELGLKACIARQMVAETIPDRDILKGFLDHQISKLVGLAGLTAPLRDARLLPEFDIRWVTVSEWSVDSRYDSVDAVTAATMKEAIENPDSGVLKWLRQYW